METLIQDKKIISRVNGIDTMLQTHEERYQLYKREVQGVVRVWWIQYSYGPTFDEIVEELKIKNRSIVRPWIYEMRERGDLLFEERQARTIRLPNMRVVFDGE